MSASNSKPDATTPGGPSIEDLGQPEEALTPEQTEQVRGGATPKGSFIDVCKTPTPGGPIPIPYPN